MSNERGAPVGNTNAAKGKVWNDALRRAIAQDDGKRVRAAVERLLDLAQEGEPWAIKELADRLDGKPTQTVGGDAENPLQLLAAIEWRVAKHSGD
jgi:hypothetical protein